jgi:hypothetical protein
MLLSIVTLSVFAIAHAGAAGAAQTPSGNRTTLKGEALAIVNLKTASVEELDALPGIGTKTAELIVEYRQKNGPFTCRLPPSWVSYRAAIVFERQCPLFAESGWSEYPVPTGEEQPAPAERVTSTQGVG